MNIAFLGLAIVLLVYSIVRWKVHPFLALLLSGLMLGLACGLAPERCVDSLLDGFAGTLKWIGIVMVLGTLIGEILNETGGSIRISGMVLDLVGKERIPLVMAATGYIIAIPVFVDVAYIMLQPITESLAATSRRNILVVGLSLTAGLTATHALLPPTPGPLAAAGLVGAGLGRVILINAFVALFAVAGGLLWATLYCKRITLPYDRYLSERLQAGDLQSAAEQERPGAAGAFLPIFLPLALMAAGSFSTAPAGGVGGGLLKFFGTPTIALLIGLLCAALLLRRKGRRAKLGSILDRSIEKAAVVIMITGAGGAFGGVIKACGIGSAVSEVILKSGIPGLLFPFLLASALTTATGSLTVSMVTSASIVGPMLGTLQVSPELAVALVGSGSFCVFHANSSFFWLLSRLHQVPPDILYRSYSLQSLWMGMGGLAAVLLLGLWGIH